MPEITYHQRPPLEQPSTYIGVCCREWVLACGARVGRCGYCGETPVREP